MKLPISNREYALTKVILLGLVINLMTIISGNINRTLLIFNLIFLFLGVIYLLKNNIQFAALEKNIILIKYNWKNYSIKTSDITSINSALDKGLTLKGKFSTIYTLQLKRRFPFGKKLYLQFSHSELPILEPKEISILNAFLEYEKTKNK